MRLDDSEAKSGSGTSPSNGGGSQDSIDSIDDLIVEIGVCDWFDIENKFEGYQQAKTAILAWHNTQLQAAIPEKKKQPVDPKAIRYNDEALGGYNAAITDMERNLEKL